MMRKIIFLLISLLFGSLFSSCNTTKRAEKRIYKITEQHPELITPDTVKIDTVLTVKPAADSVDFAFDEAVENQTERAALANKLFGSSGAGMMSVLSGSDGIQTLREQAHELNLVMSDAYSDCQ